MYRKKILPQAGERRKGLEGKVDSDYSQPRPRVKGGVQADGRKSLVLDHSSCKLKTIVEK